MQKLSKLIIISMAAGLLLSSAANSQSDTQLANLYRSNQVLMMGKLHKENKIQSESWKLFVEAIFENDAEAASQKMLLAYSKTGDAQLQTIIKERVSQFYSARGYYETSRRILNDDVFFQKIIAINGEQQIKNKKDSGKKQVQPIDEKGNRFGVQVGAFSTVQNAENVSRKYEKQYSDARVMKKVRNGNSLYIVVVGDYNSREEAENAIPAINNKLNVKGYIIQF